MARDGAHQISVFANADITFPDCFRYKVDDELSQKQTLLCITRHEYSSVTAPALHSSPHWSQDAWCIRVDEAKSIGSHHLRDLEIPIGIPRCDNRLAYVFWVYNWRLVNPCNRIQVLHHHESLARAYSKKDATILGAVAYVYPSVEIGKSSDIDVDIYSLSRHAPRQIHVNTFLVEPFPTHSSSRESTASDLPWQVPNQTERHAAVCIQQIAPELASSYVAFPWATWIDCQSRRLEAPRPPVHTSDPSFHRLRVTVCQHIWALDYIHIFQRAGITDLFWSHASVNKYIYKGIRIHPFPLYPVRYFTHCPHQASRSLDRQRPFLYCFQGAYVPGLYPTPVRQWIQELPQRLDACIALRSEWHFEQEVYREQIDGQPPDPVRSVLLSKQADDYSKALQDSHFALCPSGSGPNSIRIWEALGFGAIPVIISDQLRLPGDPDLWREAAVFVSETHAAINALPGQLEQLACKSDRLQSMKSAGQILWQQFGPDVFVGDVIHLLSDPIHTLQQRAWAMFGRQGEVLSAGDPTQLPLAVKRWCRSAPPGSPLLIQIDDESSGDLQQVRWLRALCLCQSLLQSRPWSVSSINPRLESLMQCQLSI